VLTLLNIYCGIVLGDGRRHREVREGIGKIVHGCSPFTIYRVVDVIDYVSQKISDTFNNLASEFKALSIITAKCSALSNRAQLAIIFYKGLVPADVNRRNRYNIQGVSGGIVNISGGGSVDYSE
jgi:hypothetical protein